MTSVHESNRWGNGKLWKFGAHTTWLTSVVRFPFGDKLKSVNLFNTLRKLYRHFPRIRRFFAETKKDEPGQCLSARHISVLCTFISRAWTEHPERDQDVDGAFFSALQTAISSVNTSPEAKEFFNKAQCERLIECLKTAFEKADRPVKVAVG
jgi:hypothetical protein